MRPGKARAASLHQGRIAHRGGADDGAVDAFFEPAGDRRHVADAAAELHRQRHAFEDPLDRRHIDRPAGKGAVEVDHMEIFESLRLEALRLRGGIAVEHRRARHVALLQAHADAVLEVDGGKQDQWCGSSNRSFGARRRHHGFQSRKLAIKASPSFWLFSGWNWVPA